MAQLACMTRLLILRPEPGATVTAARAAERGLHPWIAPLFVVRSVAWEPPDPAGFDALMLTSANALRHGGPDLDRFRHLPVYAVGAATAAAAAQSGFADVHTGAGDAAALVAMMREGGVRRPLHLAGREHRAPDAPFPVEHRVVYAAEPVDALSDEARMALDGDAIALLHSPRAAGHFAELLRKEGIDPATVRVAAISAAAVVGRWREVAIAESPDDAALLAAAARLCDKGD